MLNYKTGTDRQALLFIDNQRLIGFLHKQNWTLFTDESSYALMRHHVLLAIQTKLKQAKFYYFSFAIDSMAKSLQNVWQEEGNFEVLKRCYIQIYSAGFLLCYVKGIDLQHM